MKSTILCYPHKVLSYKVDGVAIVLEGYVYGGEAVCLIQRNITVVAY